MSKKYASKAEALNIGVRDDVKAYVTQPDGSVVQRVVKAAVILEFKPLISFGTTYDRMIAAKTFFPNTGWRLGDSTEKSGHRIMGALPSLHPQPMYNSGTNNFEGMTSPYDPTMHFGFYDTAWIADDEDRADAEAGLDGHALRGIEFIEIEAEALVAPWPSYDTIGQGAHVKIPAMVRDLGIDVAAVVQYELATKNRDGVLKALSELAQAQDEDAIDEASLTRAL